MKKLLFVCLVLILLVGMVAVADDAKPDFSGKWSIDKDKSEFGPMPAPDVYTLAIEHKEPKLKTTTHTKGERGERTSEANYTTDGEENTNKGFRDTEIKSHTKWEGKQLVTQSKFTMGDMEIQLKDVMELQEEGKVLVRNVTFSSSQGEGTQKLVFKKEQ